MRRIAILLALGCLAFAGCGGDEAAGPLDEALGYLPKDAPFAVAIDTDLSGGQYKSLDRLLDKFPFSDQVKRGLQQQLEEGGEVSFDRDVRPILGNPFVVGGVDPRSLTDGQEDDEFVGAIQAKDQGKLDSLLEREKAKEVGEKSGAKLYRDDDGDFFAVKEDVLVVAGSRRLLDGALAQREQDDRLDQKTFDAALGGLPEQALLRVYGDLEALIKSDPGGRDAQKIKWVGALRTLGVTAVARDDRLAVDFKLDTEGEIAENDLPIASGAGSPGVVQRPGEVGVGVRDLTQIVEFAESAGQAVNPSGYGDYTAAKRQLENQLSVDIEEDVIGQFEGDASATIAVDGKFGVRSELVDPARFKRTLDKIADVLPRFAEGAGAGGAKLAKPRGGDDLYRLDQAGAQSLYFGVVDEVFVLANEERRANDMAGASPGAVPGAQGAVVMNADAEKLADQLLRGFGSQLGLGGAFGARLFTAPLGEANGWMSSSADGLRGSFTLDVE